MSSLNSEENENSNYAFQNRKNFKAKTLKIESFCGIFIIQEFKKMIIL